MNPDPERHRPVPAIGATAAPALTGSRQAADDELAEHVTLPTAAELRKRSKQTDYAGLGRNCERIMSTRSWR